MATYEKVLLRNRAWKAKNKARIAETNKRYYSTEHGKEIKRKNAALYRIRHKDYMKKYMLENREKTRERSKRYYEEHKDKIINYVTIWRRNNGDRVAFYATNYIHKNREKGRIKSKNRRVLISVSGNFTRKEWEDIKAMHKFVCVMCKRAEPEIKLTQDHIIPLSRGGRHIKDNIQPLCRSCNAKKGDKLDAIAK